MPEPTIREPEEIPADCARKLEPVEVSPMFKAVLACLLDEDWTEPKILQLVNNDHCLLARAEGACSDFHAQER